jgi:hypothetical protein
VRATTTHATALVLALTTGCGSALSPAPPSRLRASLIRDEEQGLTFVATLRSVFELALGPDGTGEATRTTRGAEVYEGQARELDEAVRYDARAQWAGGRLVVALAPREGSGPAHRAVTLTCEPWGPAARASTPEVADASLPGVDWICALPEDQTFALGLVVVQHVPREGAFVLLGAGAGTETREHVDGQGRRVATSRATPAD